MRGYLLGVMLFVLTPRLFAHWISRCKQKSGDPDLSSRWCLYWTSYVTLIAFIILQCMVMVNAFMDKTMMLLYIQAGVTVIYVSCDIYCVIKICSWANEVDPEAEEVLKDGELPSVGLKKKKMEFNDDQPGEYLENIAQSSPFGTPHSHKKMRAPSESPESRLEKTMSRVISQAKIPLSGRRESLHQSSPMRHPIKVEMLDS